MNQLRDKPRRPKEKAIIKAALAILLEEGARALTMRALATKTGMSLSNVQYYFKDRDILLTEVVEDYSEDCAVMIEKIASSHQNSDLKVRVEQVLTHVFSDDPAMRELCAVFRELWAISTRSPSVSAVLNKYYRNLGDMLCDKLLPEVKDEVSKKQLKLLIIPFIEGYSVAGRAINEDIQTAAKLISSLTEQIRTQAH